MNQDEVSLVDRSKVREEDLQFADEETPVVNKNQV
jgi:hypothetical protein